jgi:tetraacyldisaccharide 4'-kinase
MAFRAYLLSLATDKKTGITAGVIKFPLFVLSLVYGLVVRLLAFLYSRAPFISPVKVISVGNITLGGTGKTMLVEYAAGLLAREGRRVAVLSRGYKRPAQKEEPVRVCTQSAQRPKSEASDASLYQVLGDEAGMLKSKFPALEVFADPDRVRLLRTAAARGIEAAILDDGFQQWRIKKDLDIVCVDAAGFGNGCLLPRGILREPLSALKRGGVFVITNTGLVPDPRVTQLEQRLTQLNPAALIVRTRHEPDGLYKVPGWKQSDPRRLNRVCLVCGIGNPDSFFGCCRMAGIAGGARFVFPDHHGFTRDDIRQIAARCNTEGVAAVVTTEKDAMRLPAIWMEEHGLELYVLRAVVRFNSNEQEFTARLRGLFPA